ncbi:Fe2+-dependent dioxygenase [Pseudomonas sp. NPDC089569]|uniref:Fe2+-dependent dioxygenase n=1 Tax=Pseudomonas sp. NPDC089569 TaxID=3390722 RepID=UPI003D044BA0
MMLHIPQVLSTEQLAECRQRLLQASWGDGRVTTGFQAALVKNNSQLPLDSPAAQAVGQVILQALERHPLFISAALPHKILPPQFNCYQNGQAYGMHVDSAMRKDRNSNGYLRTDLSATLFLTPPEDYDGGELLIDDVGGTRSYKLPAGDMVLYPSTTLHQVMPVTRGARICSFFWLQSMVRDTGQRQLLFQLDSNIQQLNRELGAGHSNCVQLTGIYHNLLRRWSEV